MHWNLLAQKLCDGFDLINDQSPMIQFSNRLRLMQEHISAQHDLDVLGISELDASAGEHPECFQQFTEMMSQLGFNFESFDKDNN